ncbi:MAG: hypothetical protein Q7J80_17175 [Anaerolineales bacterium]|nr:hypothetical protein [Anaerolineales bacterium]
MKRSMFVLLSLLAIAALSACAPQSAPSPSIADLQATALANAQTQIALTAASIPTATPIPPTPMPTPIPVQPTAILQQPVVAPPQPVSIAPTALPGDASVSSDNPCNGPLSDVSGPQAQVTFMNTTDGELSLYLYIYKTAFGCGIGNVTIAPLESVTTNVPKGCYDFYGWITGPRDSTPAGYGCLNFDQTVKVKKDTLVFQDQK